MQSCARHQGPRELTLIVDMLVLVDLAFDVGVRVGVDVCVNLGVHFRGRGGCRPQWRPLSQEVLLLGQVLVVVYRRDALLVWHLCRAGPLPLLLPVDGGHCSRWGGARLLLGLAEPKQDRAEDEDGTGGYADDYRPGQAAVGCGGHRHIRGLRVWTPGDIKGGEVEAKKNRVKTK